MAGKQPTKTSKGKSVKGQANGGGRPKGSANKVTKAVKEALREALEEAHPDGAKGYFLQVAADDPKTFMGVVQKLIPNEVVADVKSETIVRVVDMTGGK